MKPVEESQVSIFSNILLLGIRLFRSVEESIDRIWSLLCLNSLIGFIRNSEESTACYCRTVLLMASHLTPSLPRLLLAVPIWCPSAWLLSSYWGYQCKNNGKRFLCDFHTVRMLGWTQSVILVSHSRTVPHSKNIFLSMHITFFEDCTQSEFVLGVFLLCHCTVFYTLLKFQSSVFWHPRIQISQERGGLRIRGKMHAQYYWQYNSYFLFLVQGKTGSISKSSMSSFWHAADWTEQHASMVLCHCSYRRWLGSWVLLLVLEINEELLLLMCLPWFLQTLCVRTGVRLGALENILKGAAIPHTNMPLGHGSWLCGSRAAREGSHGSKWEIVFSVEVTWFEERRKENRRHMQNSWGKWKA